MFKSTLSIKERGGRGKTDTERERERERERVSLNGGRCLRGVAPDEEEPTKNVFEDDCNRQVNGLRLRDKKNTMLHTTARDVTRLT